MNRSEAPTGDSIAQQIKGRTADSNFADIARQLTDDHARRPGLFRQDLASVNKSLHDQGILPGVDIVGVNGQDLVGRKADGSVVNYDATDLSHSRDGQPGGILAINGRTASREGDGSGQVVVKQGDSPWTISRDVLKSQGVNAPTDNQIANYVKELQQENGKTALAHLKPGESVKLPAAMKGGADTMFTDDRANGAETKAVTDINANYDAAKAALAKTNWNGIDFQGISKERLQSMLTTGDLNEQEQKGMQFLVDNYSRFEQHVVGGNGRSDQRWFDSGLVDKWQQTQLANARLDSFEQRKDD
jgi:hypothetical protein